ncbi:MAG: hypothetical protein WD066_12990 [Planctomycetaceae bacterium]
MSTLPPPFLFRYALPVMRIEGVPLSGRREKLLDLPPQCAVGSPAARLGRGIEFGELRAAWNDEGFGLSVAVTGKRMPLACDARQPDEADGLRLWIDTRDTQSIHRAGRYCHCFCVLPAGSGPEEREPTVAQLPIARAREDAPRVDASGIPVRSAPTDDGYLLEVWFPAEMLHGFDPEASPRLGFYYVLKDAELGEQHLTLGSEFPYSNDPSLWSTLELVR